MHSIQWFALAALLVSGGCRAQGADNDKSGHVPEGFSLQWEPDFDDDGILQQLEFTDPKAWRRTKHAGRSALELAGDSRYTPKCRSVTIRSAAGSQTSRSVSDGARGLRLVPPPLTQRRS